MSQVRRQSLDRFVENLEKKASAARTISVSITIGTIILAALALFFTIRAIRKQIRAEQANLVEVTNKRVEAETKLADLNREYELKVNESALKTTALDQLPDSEREQLLKQASEVTSGPSDNPKVYLQILDNGQRSQANGIATKLKGNGFRVQGVEWVRVPVTLAQTQVKYFRAQDLDETQKLIHLLKQSGIQASPVALNASAAQIEIWFSRDAFPQVPTGVVTEAPVEQSSNKTATAFAVINNFKTLEEAQTYGIDLRAKGIPYPVEIYRRDVNRFYVTLGGYLSNSEAKARVLYAKKTGLSAGAYPKNAPNLGGNLMK